MIEINFAEANLDRLAVHFVGNKSEEEGFRLSLDPLELKGTVVKDLVFKYLTSPFKPGLYYNLTHQSSVELNEVFSYVDAIFSTTTSFFIHSVNLAKHLYEKSTHPKIRGGEFYAVYFSHCIIEGELVDAIGLFKSESKETYLRVSPTTDNFEIDYEDGININKLDKGAIIFNYEREKGYLVAIVDNLNKGNEAQYWKDDFLHVRPREDEYHHTQNALSLCKDFVVNRLPEDFEVSKADQVDLLNRSIKFFKEKDTFSLREYSDEVLEQPDMMDSFKEYRQQYETEKQLNLQDDFDISTIAVKKQSRIFKSIIKLDKNFHIYIHGNRQMIEKGKDPDTGLSYYKLYFKEEN